MQLTNEQQTIINTPGNMVVQASAGTGKTQTMVCKIQKELSENHSHKSIIAITYTNKAAQEIRDRIDVDTKKAYIGTCNGFVVNEVIKPFIKDIERGFDLEVSTNYLRKVRDYQEFQRILKNEGVVTANINSRGENFVFKYAMEIMQSSSACRRYLKAKYFKIYVDEYQDCDGAMHEFFKFMCHNLSIEMFAVGDEKQTIFQFRGASHKHFRNLYEDSSFLHYSLSNNFRSELQIQNYANLLFSKNRVLYKPLTNLSIVILMYCNYDDFNSILGLLDLQGNIAVLCNQNDNAASRAKDFTGVAQTEFVYMVKPDVADITTKDRLFLYSVAKFLIVKGYSIYHFCSEVFNDVDKQISIDNLSTKLNNIKKCHNENQFFREVGNLATECGYYSIPQDNIGALFKSVSDRKFFPYFEQEKYRHITCTIHTSKGLEFDQVIVYASDFFYRDEPLNENNHYVAITRAKRKLIIVVDKNKSKDKKYLQYIKAKFEENNVKISDVVTEKFGTNHIPNNFC